jgi:hypothetical protein
MKKLSGILAIIILATRLLAQAGFVSQAPVLRVALMDFVSEDNSYRSTVALGNLVSALQAEVSQDTNYDWVERAELEKAANELKLAGLGLIDRSEAIRGGCWVKADWGIFGDISTNSNGHRMLSLEIVNLQRADVLAETNLSLPMADSGQFQIKSEYVSNIASTLRTLLNHARKVYSGSEKQDAVAFLFLSLAQGGLSDALGDLDADFRHSLFIASTNSQRFHLVQFQRAGAAMDEANLVLSGLAEDDSNAWEKVADRYVWGDARVDDRKTFDWETKNWRDERKLEVKLNVWDGRGEPQVIALTVTNETSEALARELTQAIEPLLRRDGAKPIVDNMRSRISDSLFARYSGLPINFWFDSPEGRRQWLDAVQLLETACFFNPGNAAAREQLLRLRWGTALLDYNAGSPAAREELERLSLTQGLKSASRNEFFFVRRRSEAWGKYVEQFGFKTALAKSNSPSITAEYVLSAWRPFEMFVSGQYNQAQGGVPRDAGLREVTEWQNQFGSEFISRLLKAPDQFSGMYRDALHEYFQENGQPGSEQKLLAQLKEANRGEKSAPANGPPPTGQVRLPRIAELESELAQTGDIFSVRPMMFSPPLVEPNIKTIPFPSDARVKGVKSMIFHGDTLWLAVEVAEPLEIKTLNGQIEKEFQPVLADHIRLWKLGANAQKLEPVTGSLATNDVNSMMFRNNTLWLALNDEGIAALDVKTGELQRYGSSAGIVSTNQFALADISRGIVAIGGMNDLLFLENEMKTWKHFDPGLPHQDFLFGAELRQIAGLKDKLLLYNSQLLCCDLKLNTWTQIADPPSLDRMGRIHSMTGDGRDNFWIASDSGLHGVDPYIGRIRSQWIPVSPAVQAAESPTYPGQVQPRKNDAQLVREIRQKLELRRRLLAARKMDPNQPNLFVPGSRLPAGILSVTADDDFLWVFTVDTMRPLLYHPASHDWVGGFYIRRMGTPSTLACGGGKLWLATRPGENFAILEMDTSTLKSTPREHWLPEAVSSEELAARVSDLSEHERAVFLFFSGNDEAVIKLLQARPEDELDPESLFLLSSAFSEIGQPDRAGYFEKKLVGNFPGNIFATFISSGQRLQETRTKIEGRLKESPQPESPGAKAVSAWMAHTFDADGDGALTEDELTVFFELGPEQIQRLLFNPSLKPADAAAELLQRFDGNRDGRLQESELTDVAIRSPFFIARPGLSRTNRSVHNPIQTTKP